MLCAILVSLVTLGLSSPFRITQNVVFEKTQEVSVVRASWVFSFFTDLKTYRERLRKLKLSIRGTEVALQRVIEGYKELDNPVFTKLFKGQNREILSLRTMHDMATNELENVLMVQQTGDRVKRALIPLLGKVLSFLTGTLTKADLRKVYSHINTLAKNQEQVIHVMNDTLSVLNVTNLEVQKNRHAIQTMTRAFADLELRLTDANSQFDRYKEQMAYFSVNYLQLDLIITELRESFEKAMFYINEVKMELDQLSLGHLAPTVIDPQELKRILIDIEAKIPKYLTLPAPTDNVWYYYTRH